MSKVTEKASKRGFTYQKYIYVFRVFTDSQVFAEEVEPTGAVPIELSLERYRYAALPNKFKERSEDKKLQPRVSLKLFNGTQILINVSILYNFRVCRKYSSCRIRE